MEKWEYKSIKFETKGFMGGILEINDFDNKLNELGQQGWEKDILERLLGFLRERLDYREQDFYYRYILAYK